MLSNEINSYPALVTSNAVAADINCCSNRIRIYAISYGLFRIWLLLLLCLSRFSFERPLRYHTILRCWLFIVEHFDAQFEQLKYYSFMCCGMFAVFMPLFSCHRHHLHRRYLRFFIRFFSLSLGVSVPQIQTKPHCVWMWEVNAVVLECLNLWFVRVFTIYVYLFCTRMRARDIKHRTHFHLKDANEAFNLGTPAMHFYI